MDFHSVMETFAEAWVAANTHTPLTQAAEQGLINGPTNHNSANATTQSSNNHAQPVLTVLSESSKSDIEPISTGSSTPVIDCIKVPQYPYDSQANGDLKHKAQEVHGKCLPVHCIVEQIPGPQACGQYVELDSYAIVPSDTLFNDLVRTALGKLGYSVQQILGAKGSIQVKKWKPLAFDQITENPEATVEDILGDLTTMASLHVRLYSVPDNPQEWKDITVRNAVLELLREMSQIKLAKICPLSQPMLSNIINNRYVGKIGKEKCQEFGQWYLAYRKQHPEGAMPEVVPSDRPTDGRLTFHPSKELPIMRDWFHTCRNPSRRTFQMYVDILNQGPVRQQERPKIILSTLKNWWKNEKQRERKNQRSDDKSPEAGTVKRKKKSNVCDAHNDNTNDADTPPFSGSNSADSPSKSSNFTLINHSEGESDLDRFTSKESDLKEADFSRAIDISKTNCNFPLLAHEAEMESHARREAGLQDVPLSLPTKDSAPVESQYFQKIHSVCIDHPHSLFSFPVHDSHLSSPKLFCDNAARNGSMENSNSNLSSEEDVDVGI